MQVQYYVNVVICPMIKNSENNSPMCVCVCVCVDMIEVSADHEVHTCCKSKQIIYKYMTKII